MKRENLAINQYSTSDLSLAVTLSIYEPIRDIDKTNPYKATFIFAKSKKLENLISDYWQKKLSVEPQTFFNQLKIVKARLYDN